MIESIKTIIPGIHKEGYIFILLFAFATLIFFLFSNTLGWIGIILTCWCIFFFRDPEKVAPLNEGLIISPADGVVQRITRGNLPDELKEGAKEPEEGGEYTRVSIFLSVFDIHVNRIPINGKVRKMHYNSGKFINASLDKASEYNERQSILIETDSNTKIGVVQIAGLIARRIVCYLGEDQQVEAGKRFGIIRFGSRVDVYIPAGIEPLVAEGQRMIGGETIIADLNGEQRKLKFAVK